MPCYYYVPIVYGLGQHFCNQQTKTSNNMPYIRAYSNLIEMSDITIILQQCCFARTSNPFKKKGMVMVLVTQQQILLKLFFMTVRELRNSKRSDLCHCEVKRHDFYTSYHSIQWRTCNSGKCACKGWLFIFWTHQRSSKNYYFTAKCYAIIRVVVRNIE